MNRLPCNSPLATGYPLGDRPLARHRRARAFSLVELLVVITIIGILAALITKAAANALWTARQTAIKVELNGMAEAMERFKAEYGSYPPADLRFTAAGQPNAALKAFIARAFPRYRRNLLADFKAAGVDTVNFNPARALVFWLSGFSADVQNPFDPNAPRTAFFDFDKTRLKSGEPFTDSNGNGVWDSGEPFQDHNKDNICNRYPEVYISQYGKDTPYVYFDNRSYSATGADSFSGHAVGLGANAVAAWDAGGDFGYNGGSAGIAVPYALDVNGNGSLNAAEGYTDSNGNLTYDEGENDANGDGIVTVGEGFDTWASPTGFQIISAGQDGVFGTTETKNLSVRLYPAGRGYDTADDDNITNFCEKSSLDAAKP